MSYDFLAGILVAAILAAILNKYVFFVTIISSYSMFPTLKPGDRLLTVRVYGVKGIGRGNILVFDSDERQERLVKRVIGLPNEDVQLIEGNLYVNGSRYEEAYVDCPGKSNASFRVPENHYLFLGDNRADSLDSRNWAQPFIADKNIRGKAVLNICPFHRL